VALVEVCALWAQSCCSFNCDSSLLIARSLYSSSTGSQCVLVYFKIYCECSWIIVSVAHIVIWSHCGCSSLSEFICYWHISCGHWRISLLRCNWNLYCQNCRLHLWHAALRLRSTICRHHPPHRAVLSQICCFRERKVVLFQILLYSAEPCDAGTTWLSSQSTGAKANRILLASALSSMRIICPYRASRRDWIIAVKHQPTNQPTNLSSPSVTMLSSNDVVELGDVVQYCSVLKCFCYRIKIEFMYCLILLKCSYVYTFFMHYLTGRWMFAFCIEELWCWSAINGLQFVGFVTTYNWCCLYINSLHFVCHCVFWCHSSHCVA